MMTCAVPPTQPRVCPGTQAGASTRGGGLRLMLPGGSIKVVTTAQPMATARPRKSKRRRQGVPG